MSRPRRPVQEIDLKVRVRTADTRDDAPARILKEVRRHLELSFGSAVQVELIDD